MTATTAEHPASARRAAASPATTAAPPATAPRTRVLGGAFIAAPLLLVASSIAWVADSDTTVGALGFYAFAAMLLVVVTLTQVLAPALPRAAAALTVLGVLGAAAGVGFSVDGIHADLPGGVHLVDEGGTAGALVANVPGLMFPLACIGIGVALLRVGVQPRLSGAALVVAGVLFPAARIGEVAPLALAVDLIFLLALAPLGWAILRGRDVIAARRASDG